MVNYSIFFNLTPFANDISYLYLCGSGYLFRRNTDPQIAQIRIQFVSGSRTLVFLAVWRIRHVLIRIRIRQNK